MKSDMLKEKMKIPDGVTVKFEDYVLTVTGPKGELAKKVHTPKIKFSIADKEIELTVKKPTKREKKMVFTYIAHLKNLFKGVQEGFTYKMKICSGHFPMTVSVKNDLLEVKNFFGENITRKLQLKPGTKVKVDGDMIIIESIDKEKAGQTAADIEQLTKRTKFDRRIFQDGIYIVEKDGKAINA